MSFDPQQFRKYIIQPTLMSFGLYSQSAANLLMGTAAQESHLGKYVHQINGPALGVFQMEPATHDDIRDNYIAHRQQFKRLLLENGYQTLDSERLVYDLKYATIMSRFHYYRIREALPAADNLDGLAYYWKEYYNTHYGAGKPEEFLANYNRFVRGK